MAAKKRANKKPAKTVKPALAPIPPTPVKKIAEVVEIAEPVKVAKPVRKPRKTLSPIEANKRSIKAINSIISELEKSHGCDHSLKIEKAINGLKAAFNLIAHDLANKSR